MASESTDGEIRFMYKSVNTTKDIQIYVEDLSLHTSAPTVHWEYNASCISAAGDKLVTPIVKHIDIPVCFIQEQFGNGLFVTKYDNSSVITEDM